MLKINDLVIVEDKTLKDMYIAVVLEDSTRYYYLNILVKILRILRYPRQTAVIYENTINEHAPLKENSIYRLSYVSRASENALKFYKDYTYDECLKMSIVKSLSKTAYHIDKQKEVIKILERHLSGDLPEGKRSLLEG